jgi:hypothetical protein
VRPVAESPLQFSADVRAVGAKQVRGEPQQPFPIHETGDADADGHRSLERLVIWAKRRLKKREQVVAEGREVSD